jgi:hypothetical protein
MVNRKLLDIKQTPNSFLIFHTVVHLTYLRCRQCELVRFVIAFLSSSPDMHGPGFAGWARIVPNGWTKMRRGRALPTTYGYPISTESY